MAPDEMSDATQLAAEQVAPTKTGLPGLKVGGPVAAAVHDRSLGAVLGGAVTLAGVHLVGHLTGHPMDAGQVVSVGVAGAGLGGTLAAYVPARHRGLLQAVLLFGLALAGAVTLSGCAVTLATDAEGGRTLGAYTGLAPSDEIQTVDLSVIGVSVDATRQSLDIGYKRIRQTRVPAFDKPALVPSIQFQTTVGTAGVTDQLKVGEKP